MKVALCLSGQPRGLETAYTYIKKNLLDVHDVDVFVHSWINAVEGVEDEIDRLYDPVDVQYTSYFNKAFLDAHYTRIASQPHPASNTTHMLASVFFANELKRKHELINGFKYDIVVRSRFDYALNRTLPIGNHLHSDVAGTEPGKIYVPSCRIHPQAIMCNDQFAWGTSEAVDLYSQTFINVDRLYKMGFIYNGEDLLSGNLQINDLTGVNMVYVDMNNPFPPGPYNSTTHSLVREDFKVWNELRG